MIAPKHTPPELEAYGPYVSARRGDTTHQVADCSMAQHGADYARQFAASVDMLTALETVLAGGHLTTGEQAIVANAIAKASGKSIDEVLRAGE